MAPLQHRVDQRIVPGLMQTPSWLAFLKLNKNQNFKISQAVVISNY